MSHELNWNGETAESIVKAAAARGLELAAEHLMAEAVQQCPVDQNTLRLSARKSVDPETLEAVVSFNTPYAVIQHESMWFNHPKGGKAKYLEDPLIAEQGRMRRIIQNQIAKAVD